MLTVHQVGSHLGISEALVYSLIQEGALACHRFGKAGKRGTIRIAEVDLAAFLEARKTKKEPEVVKPPAPNSQKQEFKHLNIR